MDYEEMLERSRYMNEDERMALSKKLDNEMTEDEQEVCSILVDSILTTKYPADYFRAVDLEEMNEHFGASGNRRVTPRVRLEMAILLDMEQEFDAMLGD